MKVTLRDRRGEWFGVCNWYDDEHKRREKWIPLGILTKEDRKKEAKSLVERLSGIDFSDLAKTNELMASLGLPEFDERWNLLTNRPKFGRKPEKKESPAALSHEMPVSEVSAALYQLKKGKRMLFGDYLRVWYNVHKAEVSLTTAASLETQVFGTVGPWFNKEGITLQGLRPEDIEAFYRYRSSKGASNNTLRHYHGTIRKALQYAFIKGYVVNNAADRVAKPKKEEFKGSFYNEEELKELFRAMKGTPIEFAVHMAAFYGLRREEVCGLKWDAIDFQYRTMTIKHTVQEATVNGRFVLIQRDGTKNKSSFRTLPLSDETVGMLVRRKERQEKLKKLFGDRYNHKFDDYVYVFEDGSLVRPNWVSANFKKALEDNGLRHIRFHDLRHSCATLLRHEGVAMEDIQKWLGHSNILTTEQIYAHYDEGKKMDTLEKITKVLEKKDNEMK